MAEVAFSDDGKYYSAISHDGRLKIWDTETNVLKQEFTPDLHLSSPPSCLQWILLRNTATPKSGGAKRNLSFSEAQNQCIALGTTNGKILIYSVAQAKVETVLEDSKNGDLSNRSISSLDWHINYGLYSSNKDGFVYEWNLKDSTVKYKYNVSTDRKSKQSATITIKIVPHNKNNSTKYIITGSWQVRMWRLQDGDIELLRVLGHSGAPRSVLTLAMLNQRHWLIEGAQNERLLNFWDVTTTSKDTPQVNGDDVSPTKKQRKKSEPTFEAPTYSFVLEDCPKTVDICVKSEGEGVKIHIAASTRSGVVHYYVHMLNGSSTKPIKPSVTVQVTTEDAHPMPLHCCKFSRNDGQCILGYEPTPGRMVFERVVPDTKSKTQVLIRGEPVKAKQTEEINRVRTDKSNDVTYVEPMGGVSRKRLEPGTTVEVPMEARLANLTVDTTSRSKSAVNQNLSKLLMQGLHSGDKGLILTVLQMDDPAVAQRTVANLPADYVPRLLERLVDMASKKTSQCSSVCTWLSALLRSHSALLLATLNARASGDKLTQLMAIFTQRRSHLCQLLNLKGRLDLTITQRTAPTVSEETEAILDYNDSSSDEEMPVESYHSDEEKSWDDKGSGSESEHD